MRRVSEIIGELTPGQARAGCRFHCYHPDLLSPTEFFPNERKRNPGKQQSRQELSHGITRL